MGIVRHADAGYATAQVIGRGEFVKRGGSIPLLPSWIKLIKGLT